MDMTVLVSQNNCNVVQQCGIIKIIYIFYEIDEDIIGNRGVYITSELQ